MNKIVDKLAKALAWLTLTEKGRATCNFDKDFGYSEKCEFVDQVKAVIDALSIEDLETIINEKRYEAKAKRMIELERLAEIISKTYSPAVNPKAPYAKYMSEEAAKRVVEYLLLQGIIVPENAK